MGDIIDFQEAPRTVRILLHARGQIRSTFDAYRQLYVDTWTISPIPDDFAPVGRSPLPPWWGEFMPTRRQHP